MKKILIIVFVNVIFSNYLYASNNYLETNFYNVSITNNNIKEAKLIEIEKIKLLSLNNILKKILTTNNYYSLRKSTDFKYEINSLIQSIIIEDEFITSKKYSANIKINFNKESIILLLRNKKINYTDFESPNFLLISSFKETLFEEGLSNNNLFYKNFKSNKFQYLNFIYPELSPNDRFIIPYKKIINDDPDSLRKILFKYNSNFAFIIKISKILDNLDYQVYAYSYDKKKISKIINFTYKEGNSDFSEILIGLSDLWKNYKFINNSSINQLYCNVKNANIYELYFINSKINSISQIKSYTLKKINNGNNEYEITYYGDIDFLSLKLEKSKIKLINDSNKCIISIKN